MSAQVFILQPPTHPARRNCVEAIKAAPDGLIVTIKEPTRSMEQNAKMWAMLHEVSLQVDWYGQKLTDHEWKDVFSAALKRQKVVPGLDGGFVVCGQSTSRMSKRQMADMIILMHAFGSEPNHIVNFKNVEDIEPTGRIEPHETIWR
jgi:hypothetical protein